jgi:hypothetical protein
MILLASWSTARIEFDVVMLSESRQNLISRDVTRGFRFEAFWNFRIDQQITERGLPHD